MKGGPNRTSRMECESVFAFRGKIEKGEDRESRHSSEEKLLLAQFLD
jgi:hypothetical protein